MLGVLGSGVVGRYDLLQLLVRHVVGEALLFSLPTSEAIERKLEDEWLSSGAMANKKEAVTFRRQVDGDCRPVFGKDGGERRIDETCFGRLTPIALTQSRPVAESERWVVLLRVLLLEDRPVQVVVASRVGNLEVDGFEHLAAKGDGEAEIWAGQA